RLRPGSGRRLPSSCVQAGKGWWKLADVRHGRLYDRYRPWPRSQARPAIYKLVKCVDELLNLNRGSVSLVINSVAGLLAATANLCLTKGVDESPGSDYSPVQDKT